MKRICATAAGYGDETCIEIDNRIKKLMEGAQEDIQWTRGVIPLRGMGSFDGWRERKDVQAVGTLVSEMHKWHIGNRI